MGQVSYGTITITDTTDKTVYIGYANDAQGTNLSNIPSPQRIFVGININTEDYSSASPPLPPANDPNWTWSEYVGGDGVSVLQTKDIYFLKRTTDSVPTAPGNTVNITSQSTDPAVWTTSVPTYIPNAVYYTSIQTDLDNNTYPHSTAVIDQALTDMNYNAYLAQSLAQSANENAQGALSIATGVAQYFFHIAQDYSASIPAGSYIAEQDETSFKANPTGGNLITRADGVYIRKGVTLLTSLTGTALTFYNPSTTRKTMELASSGLTFYDGSSASGGNIQAQFGSSGAIQSGDFAINAATDKFSTYGTKIDLAHGEIYSPYFRLSQGSVSGGPVAGIYMSGTFEATGALIGYQKVSNSDIDAYWRIGYLTDTNQDKLTYERANGTGFIELAPSSTFILQKNKLHTAWFGNNGYLTYPQLNSKYYDFGMNLPTSLSDKFLYIRYNTGSNLSTIYQNDSGWVYPFYIDGEGNVYAPNLYKWQNDSWVPVDAGGAVDSASKLSSYGGTSNRPVYFPNSGTNQGKPVQITVTDNSSATAITSTDTNLITARTLYYAGYTKNTGTVTSVQVQASSPLQSSTNTAQTSTLNTTISFTNQNKNTVLAGPGTGSAAAPTFRALVAADIPDLSSTYLTSHQSIKTLHSKTLTGTGNVTLTASDVGALPSNTTYVSKVSTTAGTHTVITNASGAVSFNVPTKTSHLTNDSSFATTTYVDTAISGLPEPMIFKGSLGTGGTISTLPTASASNEGYTYKVITAGTYASQAAKVGDTFISDGSAWVLIPSGDEPSGTVTSIATSSPITGGTITSSGTIGHATSGVGNAVTTAGFYKFKYDTYGHVTGVTSVAKADITGLGIPGSDTHYTANLITGANASAKTDAASSNSTYLNLVENDTVRNSHQIIGSGTVSVSNDANGKITIIGSAHPTTLPNPKSLKLKVYSGTSTSSDTTYYGGENANTEVSVAGATAITGVSASAAAGGSTTFTLTKANGSTSTFDVTVTASVATGATKMTDSNGNTISEGSATNPVYFSAGVPVATTYSLNKTVPSNAVFTDTWTAMVGATSSANGSVGYVNAVPPKDGYNTKFLRADGTWVVPGGTYSLPLAANGTRGGVQIGYTQSGKNYPVQLSSEKMYVNVPWENTTYSAGTGLSLSGTTFNHSNSVTAGTAGTSSATSGSTLAVPYVTYDAQGHVTASGTHTHTITGFLTTHQTLYDENIQWGPTTTGLSGNVSPVGASLSLEHSANRIAYLNPAAIQIEYTTNGGSSWADSGYSDTEKTWLCTGNQGIAIGQSKSGYSQSTALTTNHWTRITLTGQNGTTGYVYTAPRKLLINMGTAVGVSCLVEYKTGVSGASWQTFGTYTVSGWSGWNDIPLILGTFGGGTTQTSNNWYLRFTFKVTSTRTDTYKGYSQVLGLRLFGSTDWTSASSSYGKGPMSSTGHLYSYDVSANATFPAKVTANGGFSGNITGNVTGNVTGTATGNLTSVQYDTTNKKITYTKNGSNTDVVTASTLKTDMSLNNVENTKLSTWAGSSNITTVGTISSGTWSGTTIAVTKGGTGMTTATNVNAVVIGNSSTATNAMQTVRTGNGAFYATAQDAKPTFGTLPVGQGGTGLTSSPSMLTNLASTTAANVLAASPRPGVTGTLGVGNGGTGQTSAKNAANAFLNALDTGSSTPVDADYYISQYVGGSTTTTTYHRRPMSALWSYISNKISASGTYVQKSGDVMTGTLETPELIAIKIKADDVVTQLLTAEGIQTKNWTASNISTIDGSFYICPTISCISGTIKYVSSGGTLEMNAGNGYSFDINSIFTKNNNSAAWTSSSWVMVTGEISIDNEWVPIGTIRGKITATAPTTSKITIGNLTSNLTDGLSPKILELMTNNVAHTFRNLKISLYSYFNNSQENLLGIMLTTAGAGNRTYIDIYDGTNKTNGKTSSSGFVYTEPMVRIGNLNGLNSYTQANKYTVTPTGWGIYTTNGFFIGDVYAENGYIGGFTIGTSDIHNGKTSKSETTNDGVWVGTDGIGFGKGVTYFSNDGTGKIGPWTLTKTALYNGSTGINNTTSGVYLGYTTNNTGLNISGGSAATTITIANSNFTKTINGTSYSTLRVAIGSNFGMDSSGNIYANGANITNINANNISTNMLSAMQAVVSSLSVLRADMGSITAGSISRGNNSINFNQDAATLEFKNSSSWVNATRGIQWTGSDLNIKGNITAYSLSIGSGATVSGLSTSNINGIDNYSTKSEAQEYADEAEANASYSVEIKASTIDYDAGTATLVATPYYQGSISMPTGVTISYQWYKDSVSNSNPDNRVGTNSSTLSVTSAMGLDHSYICVIS